MNDERPKEERPDEPAAPPPAPEAMPGLCRHCEHRRECTLASRDAPVWHCEHYE